MNFLAKLLDTVRYLRDPRVPWWRKILVYLIPFYCLFPLDFLPDLFPGVGWLDDLAVLLLGFSWFTRELKHYRGQADDRRGGTAEAIDVEYEFCPDDEEEMRDHPPEP